MFSVDDRERARARLLQGAADDARVVAAALVGSSAGAEDRWSDLDLTLGVADDVRLDEVLADWTLDVAASLRGVQLFDLQAGPSIYRVFLLPGCLQVDLSFTPASQFGATGPRFKLLFGEAVARSQGMAPEASNVFGLAVHHAVRARICVERGKLWQAEYWVSSLRDEALTLACLNRGLATSHARGADELPADLLAAFQDSLVRTLDPGALRRALGSAVGRLVREAGDLATPLTADLAELVEFAG